MVHDVVLEKTGDAELSDPENGDHAFGVQASRFPRGAHHSNDIDAG